ncbi:MAG: nuclear transport factor 2 family protein [Planctomycetota bacterium]
MNKTLQVIVLSLLCLTLSACANMNAKDDVIGMWQGEGKLLNIYPGNPDYQQIWIDYIEAHNARDLDKIASMNAEGWIGYTNTGEIVSGTEAQIQFLGEWFQSSADPRWEIRFMVANDTDEEQWLTTGNDLTYIDESGQSVREHHMHDVQIVDGKIKTVKIYARAVPNTPASRLDRAIRERWSMGKPEEMLACYFEDAAELFPQSFSGFFGHENIRGRYQMAFAEGSAALGSRIDSSIGGYTDLGDGYFIYDAVGKTVSSEGETLWQGLMAGIGREVEGTPKLIQFMAHNPLPEDVNFLPPNPDEVNAMLDSLPRATDMDPALGAHLGRMSEAWQSHDLDALMDEFCDDARLVTDGSLFPVRGLDGIRAHLGDFMAAIEDDSEFKRGGKLDYIVTGYHPMNDLHARAYGAWVVRTAEGAPVFMGGFGNVYRRVGDQMKVVMDAGGAVPFPTAEEWEEMQAAEAAAQEG